MGHSINPVSYSSLRYCIRNKNVPLFPAGNNNNNNNIKSHASPLLSNIAEHFKILKLFHLFLLHFNIRKPELNK